MISDKLIIELQKILKRNYELDLSFEETSKIGDDLVEAFDVMAQIDFREKYDKD
jgi:hypothetical protein